MDLRFDAGGRMLWDVATAVAWRLDPDRAELGEFITDEYLNMHIESVYISNWRYVYLPPRVQIYMDELRANFPGEDVALLPSIVGEHIFAAINPDIANAIQNPESTPRLVFPEESEPDAVFVDIDAILREYEKVYEQAVGWRRNREGAIKKVVRNSILPRFDKLEIKFESVSRKLDAGFANASQDRDNRFDELGRRLDVLADMEKRLEELTEEMKKRNSREP